MKSSCCAATRMQCSANSSFSSAKLEASNHPRTRFIFESLSPIGEREAVLDGNLNQNHDNMSGLKQLSTENFSNLDGTISENGSDMIHKREDIENVCSDVLSTILNQFVASSDTVQDVSSNESEASSYSNQPKSEEGNSIEFSFSIENSFGLNNCNMLTHSDGLSYPINLDESIHAPVRDEDERFYDADEEYKKSNAVVATPTNKHNEDEFFDAEDTKTTLLYALNLPNRSKPIPCPSKYIFTDIRKALEIAKKHEHCRFKMFYYLDDALRFVNSSAFEQSKNSPSSSPSANAVTKKFSVPAQRTLNAFCKCVENGNLQKVKDYVNTNPCFLISDGDTPTILQISCRYNAMHIAAKHGHAQICEFILECVGNPSFIKRLYDKDSDDQTIFRINHITDHYLNSPDKLLNETPLHIACKFGYLEVARVLIDHLSCDMKAKNRYGQTPGEIICEKSKTKHTKEEFTELLNGYFYLPIIEKEPIGPGVLSEPCDSSTLSSPDMSPVRALAGPMSKNAASELFQSYRKHGNPKFTDILRRDASKGSESVLRELARRFKVPFVENWPFLNVMVDLSSNYGLRLFDCYLRQRIVEDIFPHHKATLGIVDSKLSDKFVNLVEHHGILLEDPDVTKAIMKMCTLNETVCFVFHNVFAIPSCLRSCWQKLICSFCSDSSFKAMALFILQQMPKVSDADLSNNLNCNNSKFNDEKTTKEMSDTFHRLCLSDLDVKFLKGETPSRLDFDAMRAIGEELTLDNQFPFVAAWKERLLQSSVAECLLNCSSSSL